MAGGGRGGALIVRKAGAEALDLRSGRAPRLEVAPPGSSGGGTAGQRSPGRHAPGPRELQAGAHRVTAELSKLLPQQQGGLIGHGRIANQSLVVAPEQLACDVLTRSGGCGSRSEPTHEPAAHRRVTAGGTGQRRAAVRCGAWTGGQQAGRRRASAYLTEYLARSTNGTERGCGSNANEVARRVQGVAGECAVVVWRAGRAQGDFARL